MQETKLYKALIQLSGHELNRLDRFINSPYFNRSEPIIKLFEWIKSELKSPLPSNKSKEELWSICYGYEESYNDGRFRKLQSDLLKLVEEYYAQEIFESNPIYKAKYLLEAINEKNIDSLQKSALRTAEILIDKQVQRPAAFYYYNYEIEQRRFDLNSVLIERSSKSNIEEIAQNLDKFYLAEKLRYYCTVLNHQHLATLDYKMLFIDEIILHVEKHNYDDVPPILIYYQIILTYKEPDIRKHYDHLKHLISKYIHLFPESESKEIIDASLNYCIKHMNAGDEYYIREAFDIYVNSLDNGLIFVKGQITPWSFKNIVTAGLRLNEFDWIENFINKYSNF